MAQTWEDMKLKIASLGFVEEHQGYLEVKLRKEQDRDTYFEGSDEKIRGRLQALLGLPAAAAAQAAGAQADRLLEDVATIKRLVSSSSEASRSASSIQMGDLDAVESALSICFVPFVPEDEGIDDAAMSSMTEDSTEFTWDANRHEAKHRDEYMEQLRAQVALPAHLRWSRQTDKTSILKTSMHAGGARLPFSIGCRTDAMVVAARARIAEEGSIVATVEMKKKVVLQSLRQTKTTFICASLKSHLPVISCVTDMGKAAVAYYTSGQRRADGRVICVEHIFKDATGMMQWLRNALSAQSVSPNVLKFQGDELVLPKELPNPKRVRLPVPPVTPAQATELQGILKSLFAVHNDIAPLGDVQGDPADYQEPAFCNYIS